MAFDYSLRFTGQDDLSGILGKVKKEIKDMGKEASNVELVDKAMEKIITSSGKLKTKLNQTSALLAEMKFDGDYNAAQFLKVAQAAGEAKDAIGDTRAMVNYFADDHRQIKTAVEGFQALAAAGSVATGVMGMLGVENEKVNRVILQCQSYLSVLNGLKTISNLLDKQGYLMTYKKVTALMAEAAAQTANTTATATNTAATQAWNVAKAIGKALLGDWTGLLLVGGAALIGYATYTSLAADEQENLNEKNEEGTSIEKKAIESASEKIAKLRTLYSVTQDQTRSLQERNAAANEMRAMNPDILSGLSNEAILAGDAADAYNDMADAIIRIAMAEAAYDRIKELTKELLELEEADRKFNESDLSKGLSNLSKQREDAAHSTGQTISNNPTGKVRNPRRDEIEGEIGYLTKTYGSGIVNSIIGGNRRPSSFGGRYRRGGSAGGSGTTSDEVKGIIANYEKDIKELQEKVNSSETEEDLAKNLKLLADKKKEYADFRIKVGLDVDPVIEDQEKAAEKLKEELKNLSQQGQELFNEDAHKFDITSSFDKATGANPFNGNTLEGLKAQMDANDRLLNSFASLAGKYEELGQTGTEEYQQIIDKIYELIEAQRLLGGQVQETQKVQDEEAKKIEAKKKLYEDLMSTAQSLGSGLQSLGQEEAAAAIQIATTTAQAVQQIIPQVMALIGVKQGEALASGTASAAAMPFPANIAAIAAIVAQLMAVFATIASVAGKFAGGGVVGGGSSYGDMVMARVNAGEMILNRRQQANLFRAIESGDIGAGHTVLVPEFKIKGSDLYGTLRNFSKSVGKTGKVTGIR